MMRRACAFLTCLLLLSGLVAPAAAETKDSAAAEMLFQRGRELLDQREYERACDAFRESVELELASGAVMNLAACEEARGNLARAWERWEQALRLLPETDPRRSYVTERLDRLEQDVPRLTVAVAKDSLDKNLSIEALTVERDGVELGGASIGEAMPVDPGQHTIIVRAPGRKAKSYNVYMLAGQRRKLVVAPGEPDKMGDTQRTVHRVGGISLLGVGLGGVGAAVASGIMLEKQRRRFEDNCDPSCNDEGVTAADRGKRLLAVNTASWAVGAVGILTGSVLLFTTPKKKGVTDAKIKLSPTQASLTLRGVF